MKHWILGAVFATLLIACTVDEQDPAGFVITNARVVDGSGGPSQSVNVRVVDDRIVAVGNFDPEETDEVLSANGLVLAPGFIDTHSHHDGRIFELPDGLAVVNQGGTTVVVGNDGRQNFPLTEFFARLEAEPVAINFASYAGHGSIRSRVMQEDYMRHATPDELQRMVDLLEVEMQSGALGFSTGLEYDPGSFASTEELVRLATVARSYGGIYASHIRSEDLYFWEAIHEAIGIGLEAKVPVRITHMKLAISKFWGRADELIDLLDTARAGGVDVTADIYPYGAWYAGFSWFKTLYPDRDLSNRAGADYIVNEMLAPDRILIPVFTPDPSYNGMTLAEISGIRETDPVTTLMELLVLDDAAGGFSSGSETIAFAMREPDIERIFQWPHTVMGTDGDASGAHPRGFSAFAKFLGHYVRDREVLSLEEGVRRITSLPAEQVGISGRGLIREGYYADLVLFDPETIIDNATFEDPHVIATGIESVWVNGKIIFDDGMTTANRPGRPIRRDGMEPTEAK